jgi:WD40 repeat protein
LAAICETGQFRSWRWDGRQFVEEIAAVYQETPNAGQCVAFSRDGAELYVGGTNPDGVEVWNLKRRLATGFVETLYGISTLAVSPDNRSLLAAHEGVFVIDRQSLTVQHNLSVGGACTTLTFANGGRTLIVGYRDGVVRLWDLAQGRLDRVLPEYDRSDAEVEVLMFSDDGRTLVAGDNGGRVRFWNTATWDYCGALQCFTGEDNRIQAMCLSPHGDAIEVLVGNQLDNRRLETVPLTPNASKAGAARARETGT